jgi:hypothetical protein
MRLNRFVLECIARKSSVRRVGLFEAFESMAHRLWSHCWLKIALLLLLLCNTVTASLVLSSTYSYSLSAAKPGYHSAREHRHLASVLGEDNRIAIDAYARVYGHGVATLYRYYPTRKFVCGNSASQANIVWKSNIILVSGHSVMDDNCKIERDIENCALIDHDGKKYKVEPSSLTHGNIAFAVKKGTCGPNNALMVFQDWAVFKLRSNIPDIVPYKISAPKLEGHGRLYVVYASGAANFGPPANEVPSFQSCRWRSSLKFLPGYTIMKTDCDSGPGMSGSPLLQEGTIEGVLLGGHGKPNGLPFDVEERYTFAIPISREILSAVYSAAGADPKYYPGRKHYELFDPAPDDLPRLWSSSDPQPGNEVLSMPFGSGVE